MPPIPVARTLSRCAVIRRFIVIPHDFVVHGLGQVAAYHVAPAVGADQAFDHGGRYFGDFARRHQEDRRNFGCKVAVDIAHGAFVFVVGGRTDAANDKSRADFARVADKEAVFKYADADVGEVARNRFEHGAAFVYGVGVAFFRVDADGDDEFVKKRLRFFYHPKMTERRRVETACVNSAARGNRFHGK